MAKLLLEDLSFQIYSILQYHIIKLIVYDRPSAVDCAYPANHRISYTLYAPDYAVNKFAIYNY